MITRPSKLQPALVGGILLGLLSSIPIVNLGNFCCCLWVIAGGVVAARMLINRSHDLPVNSGDGAVVGALAGVVGAVVSLLIGLPLGLLIGEGMQYAAFEWVVEVLDNPQVRDQMRESLEQLKRQQEAQSIGERVISSMILWFVGGVITVGFATLGGVLGVALFEKRKAGPRQPPTDWSPPTPPSSIAPDAGVPPPRP
jgi:hypothetical protein